MKLDLRHVLCAALAIALVPATPAAAEQFSSTSTPAIGSAGAALSPGLAARPVTAPRSVLVDAASATMFMMENGRVVDTMKVIVGKPDSATPELKTALTFATFNPFWHVPPDIARTLTAPNVVKHGTQYLEDRGYEVVTSFDENARVVDPSTVDWQAVADGQETVLVRQRPGPANSMGKMKFSLLNANGIYLHDTPRKALFEKENRSLSAGCIRLEDAPRFAQWLLGENGAPDASAPEQRVSLKRMVPVTVTYLSSGARMQLASLR
ncbi:L,D-transpeptidase family protein [Sphingomonas sabuli]|uniref:L,D-transpeptidase family protein n=1 Tax=Sphingomonas sabuli TaxID=2764186 RepID=A0A7G9L1B5_9SPHN|nr:L,D-transpeptidase family protein [Sphingomonas sabuli]QNM82414.1 L,D-transpeptidase family protein [Sphingomonas sabuli]